MGIDTSTRSAGGQRRDGADDTTEFSIVVSMRGRTAHLAVKGTLDDEAQHTLEHLVERLPEADVTEVVIDLGEHVAENGGQEVVEAMADASPVPVTVAGNGVGAA